MEVGFTIKETLLTDRCVWYEDNTFGITGEHSTCEYIEFADVEEVEEFIEAFERVLDKYRELNV